MIKYVENNYLDISKYDECVKRHNQELIYGLSWYLNTLCPTWDALVLNDYDAVLPVPYKVKWGIKYFYRPFGVQQLGVFSKKPIGKELLNQFAEKAQANCRYLDLYFNEGQKPDVAKLQSQAQQNQMLNLSRSYEDIYQGYSNNLKRKLKREGLKHLQLFEHDGPEVVLNLFKSTKGKKLNLSEHFYRNFKKIMYLLVHKGLAKVYTVYGGPNSLMAATFFIEYKGRSTLLSTAVSDHGRDYNAMAYLINEYIIFKAGKAQWLDFEGSNDPGIARFNKMFGAKDFEYYQLKYSGLPAPLGWLHKIYSTKY